MRLGFCSGGVQEGSISESTVPAAPPRPKGIPAHYIFDREVELWMPPSAIEKAAAAKKPAKQVNKKEPVKKEVVVEHVKKDLRFVFPTSSFS